MKAINLHDGLLRSGLGLTVLIGGMLVFATPTRAQVADKIYNVTITPVPPGPTETACFQFDAANTLTVTVQGGTPIILTYATSPTAKPGSFKWQAVSRSPYNITASAGEKVSGTTVALSRLSSGVILTAGGKIFTFKGTVAPNCAPPPGTSLLLEQPALVAPAPAP